MYFFTCLNFVEVERPRPQLMRRKPKQVRCVDLEGETFRHEKSYAAGAF